MCSQVLGTTWFQHLEVILVGLWFLPTKIGVSPYLLIYKQSPSWIGDLYGPPSRVNMGDLPEKKTGGVLVFCIMLVVGQND